MEPTEEPHPKLTRHEQLRILNAPDGCSDFEEFIHKKIRWSEEFFSRMFGELDPAVGIWPLRRRANRESTKLVLGMAHLDGLTFWQTSWAKAPAKFSASSPTQTGKPLVGDVKYHIGHSTDGPRRPAQRFICRSFQSKPSRILFNAVALGPHASQAGSAGDATAREE